MESKGNSLSDFLLSEYSNIAQAHFKSIEAISTFFRYYLLIMSIPLTAFGAILASVNKETMPIIEKILIKNLSLISMVFFGVALVGICVFLYIINLRLDVVLYARAVNGVRKFFYDINKEGMTDIVSSFGIRVLPVTSKKPLYVEKSYFFPVVVVFGIINALYYGVGTYVMSKGTLAWTELFLVLLLHFLLYWLYALHREYGYLKSNIIGIDIDGVLNKHREHFCDLFNKKFGNNSKKKITPENIKVMPVHLNRKDFHVTEEEEREIFHDVEYWADMPSATEKISEKINKLKNVFKLKIYIFTYRPWPDKKDLKGMLECKKNFLSKCEKLSWQEKIMKALVFSEKDSFLKKKAKEFFVSRIDPLCRLTKEWLKKNEIHYDKLFFEKGNMYSRDPRIMRGIFYSRFHIAAKKKIRFFIEDDPEKAIKLSFICDAVFLMTHPYNFPNECLSKEMNERLKNLPANVIRVCSWSDVIQQIKRIS